MSSSDWLSLCVLTAASGGTCVQLAMTQLVSDAGKDRTGPWLGDRIAEVAELDKLLISIRLWEHLIVDVLEFLVESIAYSYLPFKPQLLHF